LTSAGADGDKGAHEFAKPGAVDELNSPQIQRHAFLSVFKQISDRVAEQRGAVAKHDPPKDIDDRHTVTFSRTNLAFLGNLFFHAYSQPFQGLASDRRDFG
jgi:hypothetical protein